MPIKRIAHRGFSSEAPENSRAAFALAAEADFYGVECDVWKSRDGIYVISHDGNLSRMCGVEKYIPELEYKEIQACQLVSGRKRTWHPLQYPVTLTTYLSLIARAENRCPVIELKMDYTAVELRKIVSLVKKYGLFDRAYFISLYPAVLLRLKEVIGFPAERLQYVYGATKETKYRPVGPELEQWLTENRIHLDTRYQLLSKGNVMRLHKDGIQVNVWTVNRRADFMRMVREFKVDMVTTEYYFTLSEGDGGYLCSS